MQKIIKRRAYLSELVKWLDTPFIKVITGIRRSGKSTLLQNIKQELQNRGINEMQIIYLNFESFATEALKESTKLYSYIHQQMITSSKYYILLDEIQEVIDWEKVINSLLVDFNVEIYLTGSNAHLLSSELATLLTGRYIEIQVFPLSFQEYIESVYDKTNFTAEEKKISFLKYLRKGGFPMIHALEYDDESIYKIVKDIYSSVILNDTVQRYKIRDIELLERVIKYVFDNIGNTFSGKNIADYFKSQNRKIDVNTIYNYLHALESAFILHFVSRFDLRGKEILKTQEKYYVNDLSLIYANMGYRDRWISGMLENVVYLELKRRGYKIYIGKIGNIEIDFVAESKGKRIYIQVAYKLESEDTVKREFESLLKIHDQFPKYEVTMDDIWKDNVQGIKHITIQEFLLLDEYH